MKILWPRVTSTEFRYNSSNFVTFKPHYKSRVLLIVVLRLSWSRGCCKPITTQARLQLLMETLKYCTQGEEDHSGELFGPWSISPGMDIGWELPPRMRSKTCLAHYPVLGCLPGKLKWRNLTTFIWMSGHTDHQVAISALNSVLCTGPVSHVEKHFHHGWLTVCARLAYSYSGGTWLMSLCFGIWFR